MPQLPAPITAARRIGGRPPRSSHCSSTLGQIRAVTVAASAGEGSSARGKVIALPSRTLTLRGRMRQPRRTCSVPRTAAGITGAPVCSASRPTPRFGLAREPLRIRVPSGKMQTAPPRSTTQARRLHRVLVGLAAADREGAEAGEDPALPAALEELDLGDVVHRPPPGQGAADREGVEEAAVVGGDDQAALEAGVLAAGPGVAEVDEEERGHEDPRQDVEDRVYAVGAGVVVVRLEAVGGHAERYTD